MGIVFSYKDLQKGEWVSIAERNKRKNRKKQVDEIEEKARNMMKKPRKVKPGYKKKINQQVEKNEKERKKTTKT